MLKSPTPACFLLPTPLHLSSNLFFNLSFPTQNSHFRPLTIRKTLNPLFSSSSKSSFQDHDEEEEEHVIGDCLVFEEGAFDDPYLESDLNSGIRRRREPPVATPENLVPEKWKEVQAEINMTKKEKRAIAKQLELGSRVEKRTGTGLPPVKIDAEAYRSRMLAKLKPVVLEQPSFPATTTTTPNPNKDVWTRESTVRVAPKDPRLAVAGSSLKDVEEFFNSGEYQPEGNKDQNSQGRRQLFTAEEKVLLNKKLPNLADATSRKWLPLHTLAASGEFYLMGKLLKHIDDINAVDKDGLTALHKAILGRKVAITNFLLRESANPFVRDKEGATLLHYAVQAACSPAIKILLLYNVDINLSDDDGWTPLHLAVQTKRTDMVRILLIKGADKTLKNKDGLTPLELCLHLGQDVRTYELIKLLKELPKSKYSL